MLLCLPTGGLQVDDRKSCITPYAKIPGGMVAQDTRSCSMHIISSSLLCFVAKPKDFWCFGQGQAVGTMRRGVSGVWWPGLLQTAIMQRVSHRIWFKYGLSNYRGKLCETSTLRNVSLSFQRLTSMLRRIASRLCSTLSSRIASRISHCCLQVLSYRRKRVLPPAPDRPPPPPHPLLNTDTHTQTNPRCRNASARLPLHVPWVYQETGNLRARCAASCIEASHAHSP